MRRRRHRGVNEIPQASLPDLAFLLLIFFITTMDFAVEQGLPLLLPSWRENAVSVPPSAVFHVRGYPGGRVTVDDQPFVLAEIAPRLNELNRERITKGEEELIVLIETHPDAETELMIEILDQVRTAESRRVSIQLLTDAL